MGHALTNTIQDTLIRWRRMKGDDVLWQPGTDHAGIATQMVVVRNLEAEGMGLAVEGAKDDGNRRLLNREQFLDKVWEWKAYSGGTITGQLRRLGASCDWSRERFTMDEGLSKAVLKVFVELYRQGLIYKDNRLVNWDPKMLTAISDLEVESREVKGNLWYFKYPIEGSDEVFPVRRIFCVGRNYAAHAREMGHDPDREPPFFFTKPADAIVICADPKNPTRVKYPSATKNLHRVAEAKRCRVEDLTVAILDRPRHEALISEVRAAGARIWLIGDGDVSAAIAACSTPDAPTYQTTSVANSKPTSITAIDHAINVSQPIDENRRRYSANTSAAPSRLSTACASE